MSDLRVGGIPAAYSRLRFSSEELPAACPEVSTEIPEAGEAEKAPQLPEPEDICTLLSQREEEVSDLTEMMRDAKERIEAHKKSLEQFHKSTRNTRYSDAPMEAYSRLARAKSASQVSAASGYARRRLAQLRTALGQDSDNAPAIRGAINQLQKAISRGEKKKRELAREALLERQRVKSREKRQQEQRLRHELQRRRTQRMLRESGYLREAAVSGRLHSQLTQTQMELRQQAQMLTHTTAAALDGAIEQYAIAAEAAPAPEISVEA